MLVTVGAYWVGESSQGTVAGCVEYIIEHAGVPGTL
jgi:hypothetical protein